MNSVRLDTSLELLLERHADSPTPAVMATVVSTAGSTYRKAGARMLIEVDGRITGLLSGGCLEQDLREHAVDVLSSRRCRVVTYDMRTDDDLIFGIGAGCEGSMKILLEPALRDGNGIRALRLAEEMVRSGGEPVALATLYEAPPHELGTFLWHKSLDKPLWARLASACADAIGSRKGRALRWVEESVSREAWIQFVAPAPAVLICGAGPDAEPLVAGLRALRFPVTIVDHRPSYADADRFPGATVILRSPASLSGLDLQHYAAAVVMSHHLVSDAAYLQALAASDIDYLGLLGPRARCAKLMSMIGASGRAMENRLRGPIGLDIGAVTPEGIALAIVAEIHAVAAGRM